MSMNYGVNAHITNAMNGIASAIASSATMYTKATKEVSQMARDINAQNIGILKETGAKAEATLAPFVQIGKQGAAALNDILGVNGQEIQMQKIQGMIQAGNMDQQNLQTLSSLYGNQGPNPFMSVMNQLTGMQDSGAAARGILEADPTQYANKLTRAGIDNAEYATDAFRNNSVVQQSLESMNDLGRRAVQNSAASKGMLNSGRTMSELYNQGQAISGQYLIPQMTSLANTTMNNTNQSGNAMLGAQAGLANQIIGSGTQLAGQLANSMIGSNTTMAGNILGNSTQGLSSLANMGASAAGTTASVLGNLGGAIAGQNTQMGNTISNATMAAAQNQSQANLAGAQLQLQMAQMMRPGGGGW